MRHHAQTLRQLALVILVSAGAVAGGCAENQYTDINAFLQAHDHDVAATDYRLGVPDVIAISSPTCPEVDQVTQQIRQDGKISLKLVGDVKVTDLTPRELGSKIEGLLAKYYVDPHVVVEVVSYESKKIYVFGEVSRGGAMPFTGRDTLMRVLADAHPTFIAWLAQVKVIRPGADPDERHEITVDVDKMVQEGDATQNVLLAEGDVVHVPPTPLGWVGLRVREVLFPLSPIVTAYTEPADMVRAHEIYQGDYR